MYGLTVRVGESVLVGTGPDAVRITVKHKSGSVVKLMFDTPKGMPVALSKDAPRRAVSYGLTGKVERALKISV
jgi:hypothetical protein